MTAVVQLGVGVGAVGVAAGDVTDGTSVAAGEFVGVDVGVGVGVGVWLGDGVPGFDGLADREGLGDRDGVCGYVGVLAGAAGGIGPGFPLEPVWAVPADTGRTEM